MNISSHQMLELIQSGFKLLKSKNGYNQATIVAKLSQLNCKTSPTVFSRINGNKIETLTETIIKKVFVGFSKLLKRELCLQLNKKGKWTTIEDCSPHKVVLEEKDSQNKGIQIHAEGRLTITQKVDFFAASKTEMIEFGLTLNSFTNYLNNRKPEDFRQPILDLLERNVKIKCYLLDPDWGGTDMYFRDREKTIKEGLTGVDKIRASLRRLKLFYSDIKSRKHSENFEVYTYRHFPSNYSLLIDNNDNTNAKIMVSNYLFGEKRAYCPVLEFSRKDQPILFFRYSDSLHKIMKGAKKVDFNKISD